MLGLYAHNQDFNGILDDIQIYNQALYGHTDRNRLRWWHCHPEPCRLHVITAGDRLVCSAWRNAAGLSRRVGEVLNCRFGFDSGRSVGRAMARPAICLFPAPNDDAPEGCYVAISDVDLGGCRRLACGTAVPNVAAAGDRTVRDAMSIWAHDPVSTTASTDCPATPRRRPSTGIKSLGLSNLMHDRIQRHARAAIRRFRHLVLGLGPLHVVVDGRRRRRTSEESRDAALSLAATMPNMTGVFMDDFFQNGVPTLSVAQLQQLRSQLTVGGRASIWASLCIPPTWVAEISPRIWRRQTSSRCGHGIRPT